MALIEIKVVGGSKQEIVAALEDLTRTFSVQADAVPADVSLGDLLDVTKARFAAEGYRIEVQPETAPEEVELPTPRRGRKPKISVEEAKAAIAEEVSEAVEANEDELKALKDATITKLQDLYVNGEQERVNALLKKHGGGAERFTDVSIDKFPAIAAELE